MKYIYFLTEVGKKVVRVSDTKEVKEFTIHVFDKEKKEWVLNYDYCGIYSGDILADVISEEEAKKMMEENS